MRAEDEARLGLEPIARRVWSLKGRRPTSGGRSPFGPLYVFGRAHPATGRGRTRIRPKAGTGTTGAAPADFAGWADPDGRTVPVVVADNAGWPVAGTSAVPPNVALHHPPACAPESQPAEPLWPLVRESSANETFPTPASLEEPSGRRCRRLADRPAAVTGAVGFHRAAALGRLRIGAIRHHWDHPRRVRPAPRRTRTPAPGGRDQAQTPPPPPAPARGRTQKHTLELADRLPMLPMYYRTYATRALLGFLSGLGDGAVGRDMNPLQPLLAGIFRIPERRVELEPDEIRELFSTPPSGPFPGRPGGGSGSIRGRKSSTR